MLGLHDNEEGREDTCIFEVQLDLEMRMMWRCLLMIICGVSVIESSPCRQAGSTLFCTERWDGEVRIGVSRLMVREWDRQWCGDGSLELMLFWRDVSCASFTKQCSYEAMKVNEEICRIMVRKKCFLACILNPPHKFLLKKVLLPKYLILIIITIIIIIIIIIISKDHFARPDIL